LLTAHPTLSFSTELIAIIMHPNLRTFVLAALFVLFLGCKTVEPKTTASKPRTDAAALSQKMIGTWAFAGLPGRPFEIPEKGIRYKHRTGAHWSITHANAETGLIDEIFGGSYTINGDEYIETQHYANHTWIQDNGKSWKFKVTVKGDTMTQQGLDNNYHEVWKRVR
jgi:hypothetical protein